MSARLREPFAVRGQLLGAAGFFPGALLVRDGRIEAVLEEPREKDLPRTQYKAAFVAPGFIDLQVNGAFGFEVGADARALAGLAEKLPTTGVTSFLPTLISLRGEQLAAAAEAYVACTSVGPARPRALPLGLHLEGPLLAPSRHGAHEKRNIETATAGDVERLIRAAVPTGPSLVRMVTLAPERPGALPLVAELKGRGIVVALGHTEATFEQMTAGFDAGATAVTHVFNAMSSFGHRAPGAVGAALTDDRAVVTLIADGIHAHPAALALAVKAKGVGHVALVTDATAAAGLGAGSYRLGGRVVISDGRAVRMPDGTLAGSTLLMDQAVRNLVTFAKVSAAEALRAASEVPARLLGLGRKGRLAPACDADLVLLDRKLRVQSTFVAGSLAFHVEPART
jgi:N-acetylglucosamine-6-phosphate deacetylase